MGMTGIHMLQSSLGFPLPSNLSASPYLFCLLVSGAHPLLLSLSPPRHLTYAHGPSYLFLISGLGLFEKRLTAYPCPAWNLPCGVLGSKACATTPAPVGHSEAVP